MDEFFQKLREIQKKERNLSGLAPVGENFYQNLSKYFNALMRKIDNNPFSFESYLLRDAQRITAEICERREHKISNSAVMNVQRSYRLFKELGSDSPNIINKIPRNSTPEEEKLYHALVDSLINYREKMRGPLRFNGSSNENTETVYSTEIDPDIPKDINKSDIEVKAELKNIKTTEDPKNIDKDFNQFERYTSEEEALIEDDIYKAFGKEPFPGESVSKSSDLDQSRGRKLETEKTVSLKATDLIKTSSKESDLNKSEENKKIKTDVLLVLDELPSIMGVDKNVYGPLLPQDIVTIPEPNARILIKNQKGKSIQKYK